MLRIYRGWDAEPDEEWPGDIMVAEGGVWGRDSDGDWFCIVAPPCDAKLDLES